MKKKMGKYIGFDSKKKRKKRDCALTAFCKGGMGKKVQDSLDREFGRRERKAWDPMNGTITA